MIKRRCVANITDGTNGAETKKAKRSVLSPVKQLGVLLAVGSREIIGSFWGEKTMKKLVVITWITMMVMFGLPGIAQADSGPLVGTFIIQPDTGPFVSISTTPNVLDFDRPTFADPIFAPGQVMFPSIYRSAAASLTVHVESNCLHGSIVASVTALKHSRGYTIPPDRILIKAPVTNEEYVRMAKPVVISEPETGSHDIKLDFKLQATHFDFAGRYSGTLTFTVMPPPQ